MVAIPTSRRVLGRDETHGCPVEQQSPGARLVSARQTLDEGRFARTIIAQNRENLTRMDIHIDVRERLQGAEALGDRSGPEAGASSWTLSGGAWLRRRSTAYL